MVSAYCLAVWSLIFCGLVIMDTDGEILTLPTALYMEIGGTNVVTCRASLVVGGSLSLNVNGLTVHVMVASNLNNLTEVNLAHRSKVTTAVSSIQATNPPKVTARIDYRIVNATRADSGVYGCQSGVEVVKYDVTVNGPPHDIQLDSKSLGVQVQKLTSFDVNQYPTSHAVWVAKINIDYVAPVDLIANAFGTPAPTVTWHNGQNVDVGEPKFTLDRDPVELANKSYVCTARSRYGTYNATVVVKLQYKPRPPVISDYNSYPMEGSRLDIKCEFDAVPPAQVFYAKEKPQSNEWTRMTDPPVVNTILSFADVSLRNDVGQYRCVGSNTHGSTVGKIAIYGKPQEVKLTTGTIYGKSVDINIDVKSATPVTLKILVNSTKDGIEQVTSNARYPRVTQNPPSIRLHEVVTKLQPDTSYWITVIARNPFGETSSDPLKVRTTSALRPTTIPVPVALDTAISTTGSGAETIHSVASLFVLITCCLSTHL